MLLTAWEDPLRLFPERNLKGGFRLLTPLVRLVFEAMMIGQISFSAFFPTLIFVSRRPDISPLKFGIPMPRTSTVMYKCAYILELRSNTNHLALFCLMRRMIRMAVRMSSSSSLAHLGMSYL